MNYWTYWRYLLYIALFKKMFSLKVIWRVFRLIQFSWNLSAKNKKLHLVTASTASFHQGYCKTFRCRHKSNSYISRVTLYLLNSNTNKRSNIISKITMLLNKKKNIWPMRPNAIKRFLSCSHRQIFCWPRITRLRFHWITEYARKHNVIT